LHGALGLGPKAFWIALTAATPGISMLGSVELAFAGMIRYLLLALPSFSRSARWENGFGRPI
jgi:hypothetical protein